MFYASKVGWFFLTPSNLLPALALLGALAALGGGRFARTGSRLAAGALILLAVLGLSPLAAAILLPLEDRFPAFREDGRPLAGAIVLGGAVWPEVSFAREQLAVNDAAERVIAMADLARRYPAMRIVFTGGSGAAVFHEPAEADAIVRFGGVLGLAPGRLLFEGRSRTTWENAQDTRALVNPQPGERWLLVTSAWHMPRSVGAFRKAGFEVVADPVDYLTAGREDLLRPLGSLSVGLARFDLAVREWVGLLAYRVTGRSDALFPGPE